MMNRQRRRLDIGSRLILVVLLLLCSIGYSHGDSQLDEKEQELRQKETELESKRAALEALQLQETSLVAELESVTSALNKLTLRYNELIKHMRIVEQEIAGTEARLQKAEANLETKKQELAGRLRDLYKYGTVNYIGVLFGATDFWDLISRYKYLSRIVNHDATLVNSFRSECAKIAAYKSKLKERRSELSLMADQVKAKQAALKSKELEKQALLHQIAQKEESYKQLINQLELESRALRDLIERLKRRVSLRKELKLSWPTQGQVIRYFGRQVDPHYGTLRYNEGIDISAKAGQAVVSVADGVVAFVGTIEYAAGLGQIIIVDHGGGVYTIYTHLADIIVSLGDLVRAGQKIAEVGQTGYQLEPMLHFELRLDGKPVDPLEYLD